MRSIPLFLLLSLALPAVHASRTTDTLQVLLEAKRTIQERADVLLELASQVGERPAGERMKHARNALDLATQCGDLSRQHRAVGSIRDLEYQAGALEAFMRSAIRAMDLAEAMGSVDLMAEDLAWLARGYALNGLDEKAVEMARKALALRMAAGDPTAVAKARMDWLNTLFTTGQHDLLLRESDPTLEAFRKLDDAPGMAMVWVLKAKVLLKRGKAADALTVLHESREILGTAPPKPLQLDLALQMARAELDLRRTDKARHYAQEAMSLIDGAGDHSKRIELLELESHLAEAMGDLPAALRAERQRAALSESYKTERSLSQVADLQVLYQVGQKDRDLARMRSDIEENDRLLSAIKARQVMQFTLILALALALILTIAALQTRRRMMRRIQASSALIQEQALSLEAKNLELERQQARLRETLISEEEKDVLLKEIHHRVKNNLQIVSSMLGMQAAHATGTPMAEVLLESLGRVRAMALVHENIYRLGDLARVDVSSHLDRMIREVLTMHGVQDRLSFQINAEVPPATIDRLIPLSLLLNELVTNSIKHAYPPGTKGCIRVHMKADQGDIKLLYSDDGIPIPDRAAGIGVGVQLIQALAHQMDGTYRVLPGDGTTYVFSFPAASQNLRKAS